MTDLGLANPLVSIIVRSVDRPTLFDTLASVSTQSYPSIELVVIAASKGDHRIIPEYAGPFPIRQRAPSPEGLSRSVAANIGLDMARGEFALFLDDDDWIEPLHIERLVRTLQSVDPNEIIASYSGTRCVDAEGNPRPERFGIPYDFTRLLIGNFIPIHSCLFRLTPRIQNCRFDENLPLYEDWDFWMQLGETGDFIFCETQTAVYRLGAGTGFGVEGWGSSSASIAYRLVLKKWLNRWPIEELERIIERARQSYLMPLECELKNTSEVHSVEPTIQVSAFTNRVASWLKSLLH